MKVLERIWKFLDSFEEIVTPVVCVLAGLLIVLMFARAIIGPAP